MADYLSAVQAAELIGCSDTFVRNQIKTGSLNARKVRGTWRIRREDALSFEFDLDEHEAPIAQDEFANPDERSGAVVQNESNSANEQNEAPAPNDSNEQVEPHNPSDVARPGPGLGSRVSASTQIEQNGSNRTNEQNESSAAAVQRDDDWRSDLLAQSARLEDDKRHLREDLAKCEASHGSRVAALEETLVVREARIEDMAGQVAVLESKVREILEKGQDEALGLANRIADLVERQQTAEARIYELQPVAERVPMLEAAVDETKTLLHETEGDLVDREKKLFERERQLADLSDDIETIASRPVAGPVFRLLTKGKLRV